MRPRTERSPEDFTDSEVRDLRRLAFGAALRVRYIYTGDRSPNQTRLEVIEEYVATAIPDDVAAQRFATAQATQFSSDEHAFFNYIPEGDIHDEEWLRFMVVEMSASDAELAFQIARLAGNQDPPDEKRVRQAREALGLAANDATTDGDTMMIVHSSRGDLGPRDFLTNREWLRVRVQDRDRSDGDIAKELARIGYPCDRSTVRLHRRTHGLVRAQRRPSPDSLKVDEAEEDGDRR